MPKYKFISLTLSTIIVLLFNISCSTDKEEKSTNSFNPPDFVLGSFSDNSSGVENSITFTSDNLIMNFECCQWNFNFKDDFSNKNLTVKETIITSAQSYRFTISGLSSDFPQTDNLCLDLEGDCVFTMKFTVGFFQNPETMGLYLEANGLSGRFLRKQ